MRYFTTIFHFKVSRHYKSDLFFLELSVTLQPIVRPLTLLSFLIHCVIEKSTWIGFSLTRPLPSHRTTQTRNKRTQTSMPIVRFELAILMFKRGRQFMYWTAPGLRSAPFWILTMKSLCRKQNKLNYPRLMSMRTAVIIIMVITPRFVFAMSQVLSSS